MKKQLNSSAPGRKLSLGKTTISNLNSKEMSNKIGGEWTRCCKPSGSCQTKNGNTCPGHNTCYAC